MSTTPLPTPQELTRHLDQQWRRSAAHAAQGQDVDLDRHAWAPHMLVATATNPDGQRHTWLVRPQDIDLYPQAELTHRAWRALPRRQRRTRAEPDPDPQQEEMARAA